MATWRAANSILGLLTAVNAAAPNRSKRSDGIIGDLAHAARKSDHNPFQFEAGDPVVTAIDLTNHPEAGADMALITEALRLSRDRRIKYVIFNKRIFASYTTSHRPAWTWGPYTGTNDHTIHAHVSVIGDPDLYDNTSRWDIGTQPPIGETTMDTFLPLTAGDGMNGYIDKRGNNLGDRTAKKSDVALFQAIINRAYGTRLVTDGAYGPNTIAAVKEHIAPDTDGTHIYGNHGDDIFTQLIVTTVKGMQYTGATTAAVNSAIAAAIAGHATNPDAHHA